ncbi:MAG: oligosaccharide flippase family protein [Candidatus Sulfotelmatobacter sp.]|jgi:O-antigen/teichoic acid export membrane protein
MELEASDFSAELSWLDRAAIAALRIVPGNRTLGASARSLLAIRGSAWTMAGYGGGQLLRLATQLLLARMLLGPNAFGLVALVSVFLSGLELLSDLGVGTDVIQHPRGDDPVFMNTAFLIQAGRGLILWAIAAALAYPFASFYHQPLVRSMIVVAAISVGLRGFASSSIWTMTRHVQIAKLTALNLGGDFVGFVVAVVWAIVSPTAWALVVGRVASSAVYVIGSHLVSEHPVSWDWDSRDAKDIFVFGTGMFLSSATYFLSGEAERLAIGKFITLAELGCFSLALALSWGPSRALQQVISQVFFPLIARAAREDRSAATRDYRKVRVLLLAISSVLGCGFILFGPFVVHLLLGPKYADAGWMLQLLGFRAALELFSSATTAMLFAVGVSSYSAFGNIAKLVFLSVGLTIAFTKYGFREAIWVLALSQLASYVPQFCGLKKHMASLMTIESVSFAAFLGIICTAALIFRALY